MFKQTEEKYKTIKLGNGTGSIYDFGCFLVSLANGLKQKKYGYTPEELNDILKAKGLWIGPYGNYIDVANLSVKWPEIFESFERIDPWGTAPKTSSLISNQIIALGRVSAKPIGGTGDHYVLIIDSINEVAKIYDPWGGLEESISKRWASFGYILGLRIFKVKPCVSTPEPPIIPTPPVVCPPDLSGELTECTVNLMGCENDLKNQLAKISSAKSIIYGKGWPWSKINALKVLLPK